MRSSLLLNYKFDTEEDKKNILREYRALLRALKPKLKKGDKEIVREAFELAADAHKDMRRKSGEPYILHPLAVARITVEEIGLGVTSACCALLHDVVEDTEVTLDDIKKQFGELTAKIIDGLTKISKVVGQSSNSTSSLQAENFRKILISLADDPRVILIKLADRLHNMRTLSSMKREKQLKISSETTYIFTPLAHRLGLYEIKTELEDLALKYTQPETYRLIVQRLAETKKERTKYINEFIKPIKDQLIEANLNFEIYGRAKSINSIYNKMKTKHVGFDEVYDLFAIRIILSTPREIEKQECWRVYSIITNSYIPSPERLRDWISMPKGNGYEALHTTVMGPGGKWVEVQIRTKRMNEIAEKGLAAHWKYKEGNTQESKLDAFLRSIGDVIRNPDADTIELVQDVKSDLFTKEIYIYTPKGEMRVLPMGATALDFAFDVHSELGAKCIGAKVNYKLVPISHQLNSGDQIEIITSSKQKPSEDWLKFVVTGKAKSRIRYYLKEEKRAVAEKGKEKLERKFRSLGVAHSSQNLQELMQFFKVNSPLDLYYGIALNVIDLQLLKLFEKVGDTLVPPAKTTPSKEENFENKNNQSEYKTSELIIFGENAENIVYKLAVCCQPIPGDDVFGYISSEGLKIHRVDCPNAPDLMAKHSDRIVKTKWSKNKEISFLTAIKVIGYDDVGIIQNITNVITGELKINMRSLSIESNDGIFEGNISIYVHDVEELNVLCDKLEKVQGINKVVRLDA